MTNTRTYFYLSAEGESDEKSSDRDADEQKQRFVPEGSGKLVHESGLNSSHSGDLCAETQSDQHGKKHDWPQLRDGQFSDQCWVEDKGQSRAISGNRIHRLVQLIGHVANDGEDDESSEYWSHAVEDGDQDGITVNLRGKMMGGQGERKNYFWSSGMLDTEKSWGKKRG